MRKGFAIAEVLAAICLLAIAAVGISQALSSARVALKQDGDTALARRALGLSCEVGLMPRTVRIIVLGASFCIGQPFWGLFAIAVLSHLTVAQRVIHVRKNITKTP